MDRIILVKENTKANDVFYSVEIKEHFPDLYPLTVFTKDDIVNKKEDFIDTRFIFSTWFMPYFTVDEIKSFFPKLEAVFYAAGTVKYFAQPFLDCGIKVFSAAKTNGIPVAEYTVAQILLANKGYFQAQKKYNLPFYSFSHKRARSFSEKRSGNYQAKVGIIGAGAVGKKVITLLSAYDLDICVYDPYVSIETIESMGAHKRELKEIFEKCDVISNHLPDIPETKGLINKSLLSLMKPTATIINTGRGAQIIEKDLAKVMKKKPYACAVLDVTQHEPLWPWSCLYRRKNIFVTPHIAGSLGNEEKRLAESMYKAYNDYISGKKNECEITAEMLSRMT